MTTRIVPGPRYNAEQQQVILLRETLRSDGGTPSNSLRGLATILTNRVWERVVDRNDHPFPTFKAFAEAPAPFGLGYAGRTDELLKLVTFKHPDEEVDPVVGAEMAALRKKLPEELRVAEVPSRAPGRPLNNERGTFIVQGREDTAKKTLARLKRDDPALADRVVRGEVTANTAARQKGWRYPRVLVTSPESVARKLREYMTTEQILKLIEELRRAD